MNRHYPSYRLVTPLTLAWRHPLRHDAPSRGRTPRLLTTQLRGEASDLAISENVVPITGNPLPHPELVSDAVTRKSGERESGYGCYENRFHPSFGLDDAVQGRRLAPPGP
jgi:hypothetical protein